MRTIGSGLSTHLSGTVTTIATCWKLKRSDGVILGFTSSESDIDYDLSDGDGTVTYYSVGGISPTSISTTSGSGVDGLNVVGIINSNDINDVDIEAGLYDQAQVVIFIVNYKNLSDGHCILNKGYFGEITVNTNQYDVEIRSLSQILSQNVGKIHTPTCQAELGDSRCTATVLDFDGTITSVTDRRKFIDTALIGVPDSRYTLGKIQFTTGLNQGIWQDVKAFNGTTGEIQLMIPMPYTIDVGDEFTIYQGCDKKLSTCIATFNNAVNFRGFPHIPGTDAVLRIVSN